DQKIKSQNRLCGIPPSRHVPPHRECHATIITAHKRLKRLHEGMSNPQQADLLCFGSYAVEGHRFQRCARSPTGQCYAIDTALKPAYGLMHRKQSRSTQIVEIAEYRTP